MDNEELRIPNLTGEELELKLTLLGFTAKTYNDVEIDAPVIQYTKEGPKSLIRVYKGMKSNTWIMLGTKRKPTTIHNPGVIYRLICKELEINGEPDSGSGPESD